MNPRAATLPPNFAQFLLDCETIGHVLVNLAACFLHVSHFVLHSTVPLLERIPSISKYAS